MTNVITPDFGGPKSNDYEIDPRFNVGTATLLMTIHWHLYHYKHVANELFHVHDETDISQLMPLFEVLDAVYRDVLVPSKVTSSIRVGRGTSGSKHFITQGQHFPLATLIVAAEQFSEGELELKDTSSINDFNVTVTYVNYDDAETTELEMFEDPFSENDLIGTFALPEDLELYGGIYHALVYNITNILRNHGGIGKVRSNADEEGTPLIIGEIPYNSKKLISIALNTPK